MNPPINCTEEEATKHLEFLITMCERNRTVWRIQREDGKAVLMSPIVQSGPPISEEVVDQVEEFKKQFMEQQQ
tara:strand:+ start:3028 stop:3246 length:219 start_codon:yes stop_codon:yes gene_type:complete